MSDYEKTELAYDFFLQRLQQDGEFTTTELMEATGWAKSSVYAYRTKKWKGLLEPLGVVDSGSGTSFGASQAPIP